MARTSRVVYPCIKKKIEQEGWMFTGYQERMLSLNCDI